MGSPLANTEMQKLVPFFITACVYTAIGHISSIPLWVKGPSKVLPIICLFIFTLDNGEQFVYHHQSVQKLLVGLFFSAMGDALLLVDNPVIFIGGAAMFALAHCTYTWAFGFKPLNLQAGGLVAVPVILGLTFLGTCSSPHDVLLLGCYCTLIGLMAWRANADILFHHQWPPAKLTGAIGAWLFMVSDLTLATNLLCFEVPLQSIIVMTTYYAAQLLITLAIVRDNKNKSD